MKIALRKFDITDIPNKIKWINDPENNRFLHYDLPLEEEKTRNWFEKNKQRTDRYDAVIEADGVPCGLIGLLDIDRKNSKAEFYISMGEASYKGKGVSAEAGKLLLQYAFEELNLNRVYLYTETGNISAQKLFEKIGFIREGIVHNDLFSRGKYVDRVIYGISKDEFKLGCPIKVAEHTPIQKLGFMQDNLLFIKRDDLFPFSFGGNKARKAQLFFEEIDKGNFDSVVTYGSSQSNHCRVVANMAAARGMYCLIISPEENRSQTNNSRMMELFGAKILACPVDEVHDTIARALQSLQDSGRKPYFIPGGGHGNIGTQAYVNCYREITEYEARNQIFFDYIFIASGTGTTQAGLVAGQLMEGGRETIIGISIARKNPRGRAVVTESVREYIREHKPELSDTAAEASVIFTDAYIAEGYGKYDGAIEGTIDHILKQYGIPLDGTYTGKAFHGMLDYLKKEQIKDKRILFIHTGGTPLFFDYLQKRN